MSLRPGSCLAALCLTVLGAREVAAAPTWLELRWPELAGCPGRAQVEATALRLTAGGAPQPVTAEARLVADAGGYTLELRVREVGGEQRRTLHSPRCEALADATAVIVAVAAAPLEVSTRFMQGPAPPPDPLELDLAPPPGPKPSPLPAGPSIPPAPLPGSTSAPLPGSTPAPLPATASAPLSASATASAPLTAAGTASASSSASSTAAGPLAASTVPPRRRPGLALGFGAAAGVGPSERFAAGLSGHLSLVWRPARLDLRGSGWFGSPLRDPAHPGVGATLQLAAGAVRGCPRLVRRTLALELCAGLELGRLRAEGVGLTASETSRGLWAAGLLAPGLQWRPLRWLVLGLEIEAVVAFTRRRYATRDGGEFYAVPPAGVRLGGGVAVQLF
ncbi:hypothetical protein [Nannocystis bainbridge]|uniref:Uncharacterized protein n=1 Tax=Nannocystis bainbridge TaxID=2995303 RepID=A0ABT5ECL0_9BACT|nr:hypothetical protein [Nannocystis bainbridge]MDC0723178.1 hypothetical protein [Nannocystis bainbridge]